MTDTTIELAHRVRIETDHRVWGLGCRAVCSCGWASQWTRYSADDAVRAGVEHIDDSIGGPADAMNELMSAMLDLQGDLAGVVVWLAENWSADLPVPGLWGTNPHDADGGDGTVAGALLSAATQDPAVLARTANRLGVPVHTDTVSDSLGHRYHRATRQFGRVEIEIFMPAAVEES